MSNQIRFSLFAAASFIAVVLIALFATQAWPTAASADGAPKIAVIDTEKILLSSATGKAALASLTKLRETLETEIKMMQNEIKDLQIKIQNGRQSLSQDQLAQLQKQLDDKLTALRRKQDDSTRDLNKKRDEVLGEIDKKVMPVLNQIGKELGYTLIFRKFESGLIYADEAVDITAVVIQRLDTGAFVPPPTTQPDARPGAPASPASGNAGVGSPSFGGRPDLFMVTPSGNVGIGTANPVFSANTAKFVGVDAGTNSFSELGVGGNQSGTTAVLGTLAFFNTKIAGAEKRNAVITGSNNGAVNSGKIALYTANAGTLSERMRIDNLGNVGIGTTAPTQLLSVNGTAGKPGGGTWDVFSDERLKNIKGGYNTGLMALMQLQPIRYEYKPDNALGIRSEGEEHIGFGAQSLQKVLPEAVTRNSSGYLMVKSDPILWTMLNAIKEQQKEIVELKGQVRKLRAPSRRRRE
jgi:Skp family chaperone for outer membrane proteins